MDNSKAENVSSISVTLNWEKPATGMKKYHVTCESDGQNIQEKTTELSTVTFHGLKPGTPYSFHIVTVLTNGKRSTAASTSADTTFKLKAIDLAAGKGNRAAAREFGLNESMIRRWKQPREELTQCKKTTKAFRGKKSRWHELENDLEDWVNAQRADGRGVSTVQIRLKTKTITTAMKFEDFRGGPSWCLRFMRRKGLSIRARTTLCQQLPPGYEEKVSNFRKFTHANIAELSIGPHDIINILVIPAPEKITAKSVTINSVSLSWDPPENINTFEVTYSSGTHSETLKIIGSSVAEVKDLHPGTEYTFSLVSVAENGARSETLTVSQCTEPAPPDNIKVENVSSTSVILSWDEAGTGIKEYHVTCESDGQNIQEKTTELSTVTFHALKPGTTYSFHIVTVLTNGKRSTAASTSADTMIPAPEKITAKSVTINSVSLSWDPPENINTFEVTYSSGTHSETQRIIGSSVAEVKDLHPGTEYTFSLVSVAENGARSETLTVSQCTEPAPPDNIKVENVSSTSVILSWDEAGTGIKEYHVTCESDGQNIQEKTTEPSTVTFHALKPGTTYSFHIVTVLTNGKRSTAASTSADTMIPAPEKITAKSVTINSVSLSWDPPESINTFEVTYSSGTHSETLKIIGSSVAEVKDLHPGTEYTFSLVSVAENGARKPAPPDNIKVENVSKPAQMDNSEAENVSSISVTLNWEKPATGTKEYQVTCESDGQNIQEKTTELSTVTFHALKPEITYSFHIVTVLTNGKRSTAASTVIPAPEKITVKSVTINSVSLSWDPPENLNTFEVTYSSGTHSETLKITGSNVAEVKDLHPGTEYTFSLVSVGENGARSETLTLSQCTEPAPPDNIKVENVSSTSVTLSWDEAGTGIKEYHVTCECNGQNIQEKTTESSTVTFHTLKPGTTYSFHIVTVLTNGKRSTAASTSASTSTVLTGLLQDLDLEQCHPEKLSLSRVLEIGRESVTDESVQSLSSLPWLFLKKLMMVNVTARSVKLVPSNDTNSNDTDWDSDEEKPREIKDINPLDIITALFLCSDSFLQQEMALKMSLCQFSVPLLLPNCDTKQVTFMLWAMREILKKFRPHSLGDPRGFVEERIVVSNIPLVSFVRLGKFSLSKSHILNMLLSNPQQYHDTFVHHNMDSGDALKRISNGLVEISWYLPCGNKSIDIFPEPVAVANLRGDISTFETQYHFLCQTSAAVFVFFDQLDSNYKMPPSPHVKAQLYLVGNAQSSTFNYDTLKNEAKHLGLKKGNVILKDKKNDADFIRTLRSVVTDVITNNPHKMTLEQMTTVAHELGIRVDEDTVECQNAKRNADEITSKIQDIQQFKEEQLPLQGDIWMEVARVEKEECRLRKAWNQDIEQYKSDLRKKKMELRQKQKQYDVSEAMKCFISALSRPGLERSYFLKWMKMNLDNLSREKLSTLREQYKEKCQDSSEESKEEIAELDNKISKSSLGIEHFLREMGQLYESAVILSKNEESHKQMLHLPKLCAELLLEGFPIELVDGDASNIPLRWVSDVLGQLNSLVKPNNKMLVVTVLGVQSTGKSTLLNTMFGVQFVVSNGRCTRGAFMVLIKIKDDMRKELNCDFLLIIDTEGLKSPELAQLDYSYEHDNELATLVVGLSDVTIINIAMENSTEMKDILQIVVHAFLRMKEVGKRPKCLFVHQNVADVSAHDKNMKDRKMLLEQLNEMTQAAAKMEKNAENKKFTDVMEYDPETDSVYIPGLWHGTPPMSPVSTGYSESVYDFKKSMIDVFKKCKTSRNTVMHFLEWTESLWSAVKHENFIFSFRNSLVADSYMKVCTELSKWEWEFRKDVHTWVTTAETKISNFCNFPETSQTSDIKSFVTQLKTDACTELTKGEKNILDNIASYYKKTDCHVELVEKYRGDFENSAKSLKTELENSVTHRLDRAASLRQGMITLESIKNNHTSILEKRVLALLEECQRNKSKKSVEELRSDFENTWDQTICELSFEGIKKEDVMGSVFGQVLINLKHKRISVAHDLDKISFEKKFGLKPFTACTWWEHITHLLNQSWIKDIQVMSSNLIAKCKQSAANIRAEETNYDETHIREILNLIDETLKANEHLKTDKKFEENLKLHICSIAGREFQKMHESFIQKNDPRRCLERNKEKYWTDFKDLFFDHDQCQRKADEFTKYCLRPAIESYISKVLGTDIVDEVLSSKGSVNFSSRGSFQYSLLKQLLDESDFENYVCYISSYEEFVKDWISDQVTKHCSEEKMSKLEEKHLTVAIKSIEEAISKTQKDTEISSNIKDFINNFCTVLRDRLTVSHEARVNFLTLNNANQDQFVKHLKKSLEELEVDLKESFQKRNLEDKLKTLKLKPQDVLFKQMFGCGKQCPFCKAPCEAGGEKHSNHSASIHRPEGLGRYRWESSGKLMIDICSSLVHSESRFKCTETKDKWHPYKDYREIFPDWNIIPDSSIQASDYWKYVMAKFNEEFAKQYNAQPADIPSEWKNIKKEQAEKVLNKYYNMH
ncbi:interferon-induced very large GTPase 1-like [Chanos chanos]|uniref:Interferon-induced very large GTPase 1-like n=1 Tax=Chanos chanos TaxID=29144 RepID=A0A6J2VSR7_CHACN|nr:interferon-induced very large GTPase 1-like [Chanos chanos]